MSTAILKKTAKALSAGLISLSVLMTVAFGAVADRFPEGDTAAGETQTGRRLTDSQFISQISLHFRAVKAPGKRFNGKGALEAIS